MNERYIMSQLSQRAIDKVAGPAWDELRDQFNSVCETLLGVSEAARGDLTTIYIKFTVSPEPTSPVYAVLWVKSSKQLSVGLALPESDVPDVLGPAPAGMRYKGLTGYFSVAAGEGVPIELSTWAAKAFENIAS